MQIVTKAILVLLLTLISCSKEPTTSNDDDNNNAEKITLLYPIGGEYFSIGQTINTNWSSNNISSNLKIELLNNSQQVHSITNIQNSGNYSFTIPTSLTPAKTYQIKIISMNNPNIYDLNENYFEIRPNINGRWLYSRINNGFGLKMDVVLNYSNDAITGTGYFYFKYNYGGNPRGYESGVDISGVLSYPLISFTLTGSDNTKFNFTGEFSAYNKISGKVTGYIDNTWGSLDEQLTLEKQ